MVAVLLGLPLLPHAALAHRMLAHHPSPCASMPVDLPLATPHTAITGTVAPGGAQCFAFTAGPGEHLTLTIDSPTGAAMFQLYQLHWKQVAPHAGAKPKWVELVANADTGTAQTWSGAVPGKGRHVLIVKSDGAATSFKLAIGIDPLHQEI